jgi:hypothetical protein
MALGRMITLSERAVDQLTRRHPAKVGTGWLIQILWDRGDVEKIATATGEVTWRRQSTQRWRADLFGESLDILSSNPYLERPVPGVFVQPWLLPNPPFPGGEVDVEANELVFRPAAA